MSGYALEGQNAPPRIVSDTADYERIKKDFPVTFILILHGVRIGGVLRSSKQ